MTTPEGEGAQSGAEGTQSGAGDTTGNGTTDDAGTGAQSGAPKTEPTEAQRLQSDLDSTRERMKAADQRAAKVEAELKKLRDKDLPEQEKLKRDFEETQKALQDSQEANKQLALKNAFLSDNTYLWHSSEKALRLVDLSQVEINADGTVSGLKDALKALATSDPYLVKTEAEPPKNEPGGTAPGNNGGNASSAPNVKGLAKRFPAMQTRVKRS
jgi:hypothetical protein